MQLYVNPFDHRRVISTRCKNGIERDKMPGRREKRYIRATRAFSVKNRENVTIRTINTNRQNTTNDTRSPIIPLFTILYPRIEFPRLDDISSARYTKYIRYRNASNRMRFKRTISRARAPLWDGKALHLEFLRASGTISMVLPSRGCHICTETRIL